MGRPCCHHPASAGVGPHRHINARCRLFGSWSGFGRSRDRTARRMGCRRDCSSASQRPRIWCISSRTAIEWTSAPAAGLPMKPEYPDRGLDHHGTGGGHQDKGNRISRVILPVRVAKSTFAIGVRRKVKFVRFDRLPVGDHGIAERRVIVANAGRGGANLADQGRDA